MSGEAEEQCEKMVRITPTVYAQMKIAGSRDNRSIAKAVDFACKEYLRLNHPDLLASDSEKPPKKS